MDGRSYPPDESASPEEVLVGAELYFYLLTENDRQIREVQQKRADYQALQDNLLDLVKKPRRQLMAPVAGGLAYFEATLTATNNILVLLGDGWFAERSASQAAEIAGRRVDFLKRELQVLHEERRSYEARRDLFLSEVPDSDVAMAQILEAKERGMERAHQAALLAPTVTVADHREGGDVSADAAGPSPAIAVSAASTTPLPTAALPSLPPTQQSAPSARAGAEEAAGQATLNTAPLPPSASSAGSSSSAALSADILSLAALSGIGEDELQALSVIDESDDLTEDELMALEKELADRIDDDDYVEKVMMERVVRKKEQRLRAELTQRAARREKDKAPSSAAVPATTAASPSPPLSGAPPPQTAQPASATAASPRQFTSPADIGRVIVTSSDGPPPPPPPAATEGSTAPPAAVSPVGTDVTPVAAPKPERHVRFAETVDARLPSATTTTAPLAADTSSARWNSATAGRQTIAVGDIVEHERADSAASVVPHPAPSKRRSLFMRELGGDN